MFLFVLGENPAMRSFSILCIGWFVLAGTPQVRAADVSECKGALVPSVPGGCGGVTSEGCCDAFGRVLYCKGNDLFCIDCTDGFQYCGWKKAGYYDCGAKEGAVDPSGKNPLSCSGACSPLCHDGSPCGAECPAQCGSCAGEGICQADGTCYEPLCAGKECGTDPKGFSCGSCGAGFECVDELGKCLPLPKPCVPKQGPGCDGCDCEGCVCGKYPNCCTENWDIFCVAECELGCGYDCSPCPEQPSCDGLECGQFCGLDCGKCDKGKVCSYGKCCTPDCTGKECGGDGCGGWCGACQGSDECAGGQCVPCQPNCAGKECGADGCGGECGTCGQDAKCVEGMCKKQSCAGACGGQSQFECFCDAVCFQYGDCCPDVCLECPDMCGETGCQKIGPEGCCAGTLLKFCEGDEIHVSECAPLPFCGWNAGAGKYACGTAGNGDPSGELPKDCAGLCKAQCEDKECGDDGCGESCGTCAGKGAICNPQGKCCVPSCEGKTCGSDGCGGSCGECGEGLFCNGGSCSDQVPAGCTPQTSPGCGGCACEQCVFDKDTFCKETAWDEVCVGECIQCGTDCPCTPSCNGKECGDDGCGGTCGDCPKGEMCEDAVCVADACEGIPREGCCDGDVARFCLDGVLQELDCSGQPSCGWDGGLGQYACGTDGGESPLPDLPMDCLHYCIPKCDGKACGDDGCNGSCGECAQGSLCVKGECIANECGDFVYEGCCDGYWLKWCENGAVEKLDCRGKGECGWSAAEGYYNCGTDGQAEPSGKFPMACPGSCVADCQGKVCGDDGCGNVCGMCHPDEECVEGLCVGPAGDDVTTDAGASDAGASDADAVTAPDGPGSPDVADASVADVPPKSGNNGCSAGGRTMPAGLALLVLALATLCALRSRPAKVHVGRVLRARPEGAVPWKVHVGRVLRARPEGAVPPTVLFLLLLAWGCSGKEDKPLPDVAAEVSVDARGEPDVVAPDLVDGSPDSGMPDAPDVSPDVLADVPDIAPDKVEPEDIVETADTLDINCHNLPPGPFQLVKVPGAIATEDLAFDGKGNLIGSNFEAIFKSSADGKVKVFVPGFPFRAGMRMIPSGELVVCDDQKGELVRVDTDGVRNTILQGLKYPNGLTVDLQGFVYLTEHDAHRVLRIHPYTGEYTVLTEEIGNPNGIAFNPAYDVLYIGTFGGAWIYSLSISPDGTPGRLEKWGDMTHTAGLLDGIGVDACGYVYVCEYGSTDIWRFPPDGKNAVLILDSDPAITYLPNMQWGRGEGWDPNSLYLPDGWKVGVWRLEVGVPSAPLAFP